MFLVDDVPAAAYARGEAGQATVAPVGRGIEPVAIAIPIIHGHQAGIVMPSPTRQQSRQLSGLQLGAPPGPTCTAFSAPWSAF